MRLEEVKSTVAEAKAVVASRIDGMEKASGLAGAMSMLFTDFFKKDKNHNPRRVNEYLKQLDTICDKLLDPAGYTNINDANSDLEILTTMTTTITHFNDTDGEHVGIDDRIRSAFQVVDTTLRQKITEMTATANTAPTGSGSSSTP
ncbi:MAG: hypothetical protein P1U63_00065 [Coxiellaceae bacterium]|nr:hypothetical protein [Coxiellaceae bacterium]